MNLKSIMRRYEERVKRRQEVVEELRFLERRLDELKDLPDHSYQCTVIRREVKIRLEALEAFDKESRQTPVRREGRREVTQDVLDHCWKMYQEGQISADHTSKEVFEQTLQSFAKWLVT